MRKKRRYGPFTSAIRSTIIALLDDMLERYEQNIELLGEYAQDLAEAAVDARSDDGERRETNENEVIERQSTERS